MGYSKPTHPLLDCSRDSCVWTHSQQGVPRQKGKEKGSWWRTLEVLSAETRWPVGPLARRWMLPWRHHQHPSVKPFPLQPLEKARGVGRGRGRGGVKYSCTVEDPLIGPNWSLCWVVYSLAMICVKRQTLTSLRDQRTGSGLGVERMAFVWSESCNHVQEGEK